MMQLPPLSWPLHLLFSSLVPHDGERKPYPSWFEPGLLLSCAITFLITSRTLRVSWYLGVVMPLALQMLQYTKGTLVENYIAGLTITGWLIRVLDLGLYHEPLQEFWKVSVNSRGNSSQDHWPNGTFARMRQGVGLLISSRSIGWNIQCKNVPPDPNQGRSKLYVSLLVHRRNRTN